MTANKPMHPGTFIKQVFLEELGVSVADAAKHLDVSRSTLNRLIINESAVTPTMARRLSIVFGLEPTSWLRMQADYDLWETQKTLNTKKIRPINAA